MHIVSTLAPVFCLVAVGFILRRTAFLSEAFFNDCAKITYWVGLPCLLLVEIAKSDFNMHASWNIFLVVFFSTITVAVLGGIGAHLLRLDPNRRKTFIQTSFHCNTAFVGLPVLMVALNQGPADHTLMNVASMALAPTVPVVNILSILVLRGGELARGRELPKLFFQKILLNPLVMACFAGMLLSFFAFPIPTALERSLSALGKMALPLALLSIGAGLRLQHMREGAAPAFAAAMLNVGVLPLIGYTLCRGMRLPPEHCLIALIILACPTASSAYIYARQIAGDTAFAASVIMISTLLSGISLSVVLYAFGLGATPAVP